MKILGRIFLFIKRCFNKAIKTYEMSLFKYVGKKVHIGNHCVFTHNTISIGNNVHIGNACIFQSVHGNIVIGNHVMFGPGVHIHGGNHIYDKIGVYMDCVHDKDYNVDGVVEIEDDVWIGANAIILKGVVVGRGSIIAANAVVNKNVDRYSIVAGNPACKIKMRFNEEEIIEHESKLDSFRL